MAKIKTKWDNDFCLLQLQGNTLQGIWRKSNRGQVYYKSDTFTCEYKTITEAKEHTATLAKEGYWGEHIKQLICSRE